MSKLKTTLDEHIAAAEEAKNHYHSKIAKINKQKKIFDYVIVITFIVFIIGIIDGFIQ